MKRFGLCTFLLAAGLSVIPVVALAQDGASDRAASDGADSSESEPVAAEGSSGDAEEPPSATSESPHEAAAVQRAMGQAPPVAQARANPMVPPGVVRVQVVDADGVPIANTPVRVGIMRQAGSREEVTGTTNSTGIYLATGLETGAGQAYRVTVENNGATYGTEPFRLGPGEGHDALIRRLPTTEDQRALMVNVGQLAVEFKEGRVKITEQMRLTNLGGSTIVFSGDGLEIPLPTDFTAFQSSPVMTDQRLVPDNTSVFLRGSLPPGNVVLTFTYDLPRNGSELSFEHALPFPIYRYRVIADASDSMSLEVAGMPTPERFTMEGRTVLMTSLERRPSDPEFASVSVTLRGIPVAGSGRWIAVFLSIFVLALVLFGARLKRGAGAKTESPAERALDALGALEEEKAAGEIGPSYYQKTHKALSESLAEALQREAWDESQLGSRGEIKSNASGESSEKARLMLLTPIVVLAVYAAFLWNQYG